MKYHTQPCFRIPSHKYQRWISTPSSQPLYTMSAAGRVSVLTEIYSGVDMDDWFELDVANFVIQST